MNRLLSEIELTEAQLAQQNAAAYRGGHAYVSAGPGTGKTRLLVRRYETLRAEGVAAGQILVLTFSRRAVQELRERLTSAGFPAGELDVRTFHGFAARAIGGGVSAFAMAASSTGFSRALLLESASRQPRHPPCRRPPARAKPSDET